MNPSPTTNRYEFNGNNHAAVPVDIHKARIFIHENSADEISLNRVANVAGISAGHLSEKFKKIIGLNFVEYVARVRFERACERLRDSDAPISEIAFEVGFQSLSQFNRMFKKFSGKSPTEYRAESRPRRNFR